VLPAPRHGARGSSRGLADPTRHRPASW
jgi:hypothetical protein